MKAWLVRGTVIVFQVLLFGSVFEIGHALIDDERYDFLDVVITGLVFAIAYALGDHFAEDEAGSSAAGA